MLWGQIWINKTYLYWHKIELWQIEKCILENWMDLGYLVMTFPHLVFTSESPRGILQCYSDHTEHDYLITITLKEGSFLDFQRLFFVILNQLFLLVEKKM
jgi:hypothetical protein